MDISEIKKDELIKEIATDFFAYTPKSIIQKIYGKNEPITESGSLLMLVLSKTDANKMIEFIDKIYGKNFEKKKESIKKKISELIPEKYEKKLEDYELHFLDIKHKSSLKDELSNLPLKSSQGNSEFNHDKYFLRLYSKYTELTNKDIKCDIYVSSEAGHYFITREQLLKEFNKNDATSYMLSDGKGQCIFNKEIFEKQNRIEIFIDQIKEIAPHYKILTIDEYNSKLFMKIENKEELESKYTNFLELELSYLQKNSKVIEKVEDMDYDNSISINK